MSSLSFLQILQICFISVTKLYYHILGVLCLGVIGKTTTFVFFCGFFMFFGNISPISLIYYQYYVIDANKNTHDTSAGFTYNCCMPAVQRTGQSGTGMAITIKTGVVYYTMLEYVKKNFILYLSRTGPWQRMSVCGRNLRYGADHEHQPDLELFHPFNHYGSLQSNRISGHRLYRQSCFHAQLYHAAVPSVHRL